MSEKVDNIVNLLKPFGLSEEEAEIYLALLDKGARSALKLSRDLKIARTNIYRHLENLVEKGLVQQKLGRLGRQFRAGSYKQLEMLIIKKEQEVEALRKISPTVFRQLASLQSGLGERTKILYYEGLDGLKQITWNSAEAEGELSIFEIKDMSAFLDYGIAEEVRKEFVRNKVHIKELTNLRKMPAWTNVEELVAKYWEARYIDPQELKMEFELLIYNNVYAIYGYRGKDIFGIEIYNEKLARMQKQLFRFMWKKAKGMKIGKGGKAEMINS
jgi:sugar-specific transcriptional regulator TrmB